MVDEPAFGSAARDGHVQRIDHEIGARGISHRRADDPAAVAVDHARQVQQPVPGPQIVSSRGPIFVVRNGTVIVWLALPHSIAVRVCARDRPIDPRAAPFCATTSRAPLVASSQRVLGHSSSLAEARRLASRATACQCASTSNSALRSWLSGAKPARSSTYSTLPRRIGTCCASALQANVA